MSRSREKPTKASVYYLVKPVFFIGFMGAGKTSVSRRVARNCHIASVDMDAYIERREEKRVRDLFVEIGEEGFRSMETDVLRELASKDPLLISCGGGIVIRKENLEILKEKGYVIYLEVTVSEAISRISDFSTRPLFQGEMDAHQINEARLPMYRAAADAVVNTAGKSVGQIASEVQGILQKARILCRQQK